MDLSLLPEIVTAAVLFVAGASKMLHREHLRRALQHLGVVPALTLQPLVVILPAAEVALAVAIVATTSVVPMLGAVLLFAAFAITLSVALLKGSTASCGCLGRGGHPLNWSHPARALGFAAVAGCGVTGTPAPLALALVLFAAFGAAHGVRRLRPGVAPQ